MKYIFDMVDFMSEIYFMKMFKIYSIHFSNIFWLGGNMNAQIYSDGVDLTSETYFIQIFPPWKPENSFMAKGSSKYQRHWSVTPFFHSNNWKCCPKSLIIEWRVDEIAISLFMCPSILYLLGGIILSFRWDNFCILCPRCLPDSNISSFPSIGAQLFHHLQCFYNILQYFYNISSIYKIFLQYSYTISTIFLQYSYNIYTISTTFLQCAYNSYTISTTFLQF